MSKKILSRREFLRLATITAAGGVLAACTKAATPTQEAPPEVQPTAPPPPEEATIRYWTGWGGDWSGKTWEALQATETYKKMFANSGKAVCTPVT